MNSGIYQIKNNTTNKIYIGSSDNFERRKTQHFWYLRSNSHHSTHLQHSFNKYGEEAFEFSIIEECELSILLEREQYYLDTLLYSQEYCLTKGKDDRFLKLGYNVCPVAGRSEGRPHTPEALEKMKDNAIWLWQQEWYIEKQNTIRTPEWHKKRIEQVWSEAHHEKMKTASKKQREQEREADPDAYTQKWKEINGRPEKRAKVSIKSKANWQDPEYLAKVAKTPERNEKNRIKQKANWDNPEYRAKRTALLGSKEVCDKRMQSKRETQSKEGYVNTWWKEIVAVDSNNKICIEFKMAKEASDWVLGQTGRQGAIRYYIQNNDRNFIGYKWLYRKDYKE